MSISIKTVKQRNLLLVWLLFFTACNQSGQPEKKIVPTDDEKIAAITMNRFSVSAGNVDSLSLSSFIEREYDRNGMETKSTYFSTDSTIMMQFINTYENGNKIKIDWKDASNTLVKYVKNSFNKDGKIIRSESFTPEGQFINGFLHQWKNNGKTEEKGPIEEGKPFKANAIYTYDDKDEFSELKEYDENDSLYAVVQWNYIKEDKNGNWTERHMITNDTINRVERRMISYRKK